MVMDVNALHMGFVGRVDGRLLIRFERVVHRPFDCVWRSLTASPNRGMWILCGDPSEISDGSSVQPPFWLVPIDGPVHAAPRWTGITRTWQAPDRVRVVDRDGSGSMGAVGGCDEHAADVDGVLGQ